MEERRRDDPQIIELLQKVGAVETQVAVQTTKLDFMIDSINEIKTTLKSLPKTYATKEEITELSEQIKSLGDELHTYQKTCSDEKNESGKQSINWVQWVITTIIALGAVVYAIFK